MIGTITRRTTLSAPFLLAATGAKAAWPDRPVRIVVAFPAGSVTDSLMRLVAEPLSRELGQAVVVDNRPGGSGVIGTESVARSAADGHTMAILSVTNGALNPYLIRRLSYDPIRDFAQIGFLAEAPYLLVVPNSSPARSVAELIELAKARPGALTFSHGNASSLIGSESINRLAGVQMTPIPYRGGPEALTDVMAGRVDSTLTDFANGLAQVREGRVRALGVTTPEPFPLAPEIPPIGATVRGFELIVWFGLAAPAATPQPVIARANEALNKVLAQPDLRERLGRLGFSPRGSTPQEFENFLRGQIETLGRRAREVGLEPQ
ncbi:Bug family tripartite tricarboxylate transporter substrate binding protein [Plastoroseomonas hellenica]|uniref:Bug family tripartite tricarboxylate transporter substrate binding protein n=1 Tax=Plastoroseomonas hellenica TaxID=2687306 RepID=UPI001BAD482E|nr:tripartite tricarboxylate transporter substrate binding protein [Plastoroseomonas hellenica]MBR0645040.1 tripartite tricarboxylate transporter substrate binding protein [Plastoroseomonas hellenica]